MRMSPEVRKVIKLYRAKVVSAKPSVLQLSCEPREAHSLYNDLRNVGRLSMMTDIQINQRLAVGDLPAIRERYNE